jgi:hypothetical protein
MADAATKIIKKPLGLQLLKNVLVGPDMPEVPETKVMPIADEQTLAAARKRQAGRKGTGRASTVLTGAKKLGNSIGGGRTTTGG